MQFAMHHSLLQNHGQLATECHVPAPPIIGEKGDAAIVVQGTFSIESGVTPWGGDIPSLSLIFQQSKYEIRPLNYQ